VDEKTAEVYKVLIGVVRSPIIHLFPMKTLLVLVSLVLLSESGLPAQTANAAPGSSTSSASTPAHVLYQPPSDNAGGISPDRISDGSRGGPEDAPLVEVLGPEHVAWTAEPRPLLYWYQSKASKVPVEVSVTEPRNPQPLMLLQTSGPISAGVHSFRVTADLKPSVYYRWSVAVVLDPENRSQDVVAYGVIKRIAPTPELAAKLAQAPAQDKPSIYAQYGLWNDALEALSTLIKQSPENEALKQERASLLKQVGLGDVHFDPAPAHVP
jgi:hypothetical protein